jgi:ribosomal protein S18 acetylase RimI-like enzyme
MLQVKKVSTTEEIKKILSLQKQNLRGTQSQVEEKEQGFVTVSHSLATLMQMHDLGASIVAIDNDIIAGFALTMTKECSSLVPELQPMFTLLNHLMYKNKPIKDYRYYVMGQICIAKAYRGKGLFDKLYQKHREVFQHEYEFVITEVAVRNTRSMRAHERVGFKTINIYRDELDEWAVVVWDWS